VAAPVIKPRMVTLVMEGVLPTNMKPATAIHKVHRTMRMFMGVLLTAADCLSHHCLAVVSHWQVIIQSGKNRITRLFGQLDLSKQGVYVRNEAA